ncbi:MAG TPA: hypothetical protein VHR47_08330 [Bacillota bacterium]|nr:hypothetical protein [Bacillota bacterium]
MGIYGDLLGYESIEVVSPYTILELHELQIVRRINSHTTLYYTAIIPEDSSDRYIQAATAQDRIVVGRKDGLESVEPIFMGLTTDIAVKAVQGVYFLEVQGVSHSYELDIKLKQRSFQDQTMKYKDLLQQIMTGYPGGDITDHASQSRALEKFIYQGNETDWQFLKRMASRFHTFLIPYDLADQPKLQFGLPEDNGEAAVISDNIPYRIGKNLADYWELSENYLDNLMDSDFTYYLVETGHYYPLGARVTFKQVKFVVAQSTAMLKNGSLLYEYLLCPESGLKQKPRLNWQIVGSSLEGKVIATAKDQVKVHLDIDAKQAKETAWWFPYATFYTAEGNSGFYCMPQLDDHVKVYFPTAREEEGVAVNSIRKNKDGRTTQNPTIKYLGTNQGKTLKLADEELSVTARNKQGERLQIRMKDDTGIEIRSDHEIDITARKNLSIDVGKSASFKAKEEVQMVCGRSSIDMDGITHFKGAVVRIEPKK